MNCPAGLVNYCVPSGEVHSKALEIARNINQKVCSLPFTKISLYRQEHSTLMLC